MVNMNTMLHKVKEKNEGILDWTAAKCLSETL